MPSAPRKGLAHLLLLAFLLLAGCAGKLSEADRAACLNLTYYYDSGIPVCGTSEECFSDSAKSFRLDLSRYPPDLQFGLSDYLNRLAQAWLHLNRAREKLNEINAACTKANDFSGLRQKANDLARSLVLAAQETDEAGTLSAELIKAGAYYLAAQDVNLIPDTPLFDDYRAFTRNENEFSSLDFSRSADSYLARYHAATARFNALLSRTGLASIPVKEFHLFDFAGKYAPRLANQLVSDRVFWPILRDSLESSVDRLASTLAAKDAVQILGQAAPREFLQAFAALLGPRASAATQFTALFAGMAEHEQALEAENRSLFLQLASDLKALEQRLPALPQGLDGFDESVLGSLSLEFGSTASLKAEALSLGSPAQSLSSLRHSLSLLSRKLSATASSGQTLGRRTLALRETAQAVEQLSERARFFSKETLETLLDLCAGKAAAVSRQLSSLQKEGLLAEEAGQGLRLSLTGYEHATETASKLMHCKQLLEAHKAFQEQLRHPDETLLGQTAQSKDCLDFAQRALSLHKEALRPLFPAFAKVKLLYESNAPAQELSTACKGLRGRIKEALAELPQTKAIQENREQARQRLDALAELRLMEPSLGGKGTQDELRKKLESHADLFSGKALDLEKSLDQLPELAKTYGKLSEDARAQFLSALAEFLSKNAAVSESVPGPARVNQSLETLARVEFFNPFEEVEAPLQLDVPHTSKKKWLPRDLLPPFSRAAFKEKSFAFQLTHVPSGSFAAEFAAEQEPVTLTFSHEVLELSLDAAQIETKAVLHAGEPAENLLVELPLLAQPSPQPISVQTSGFALPFSVGAQALEVVLPHAYNSQQILAYYSIANPLRYSLEVAPEKALDLNRSLLEYTLELENRLPLEIRPKRLSVPVPLQENAFQDLQLWDAAGQELEYFGFTGQNMAFKPPRLLPGLPAKAYLRVTLSDFKTYWEAVISGLLSRAKALQQDGLPAALQPRAQALRSQLESLLQTPDLSRRGKLPEIGAVSNQLAELEQDAKTLAQETQAAADLLREVKALLETRRALLAELGEPLYEPLSNKLGQALGLQEQAQARSVSGSPDEALTLLRESRALLSDREWNPAALAAAQSLFDEAKQGRNALAAPDAETDLSYRDLEQAHKSFKAIAALAAPQEVPAALRSFSQRVQAFRTLLDSALSVRQQQHSSLAQEVQALSESLRQKLEALSELSSHAGKLSEHGLGSLPKKAEQLQERFDKLRAENPEEAAQPALEKRRNALQALSADTEDALGRVSGEAVARYNSAAALYNAAEENPEVARLLVQAKREIGARAYLDALSSVSAATALLAFREPARPFTVPLPVYPLTFVVGTILFFRLRQQKKEQTVGEAKAVERA